jgi:hypothetical protein
MLAAGRDEKGLFLLANPDRSRWKLTGPFHTGREINHAIYDLRTSAHRFQTRGNADKNGGESSVSRKGFGLHVLAAARLEGYCDLTSNML